MDVVSTDCVQDFNMRKPVHDVQEQPNLNLSTIPPGPQHLKHQNYIYLHYTVSTLYSLSRKKVRASSYR